MTLWGFLLLPLSPQNTGKSPGKDNSQVHWPVWDLQQERDWLHTNNPSNSSTSKTKQVIKTRKYELSLSESERKSERTSKRERLSHVHVGPWTELTDQINEQGEDPRVSGAAESRSQARSGHVITQ